MSIESLIGYGFTLSIFLGVVAVGMRVAPADLSYVLSNPSRLARSLLAMIVLAPIAAVFVCKVFSLHPAVIVALVTLSIAPVDSLFSQAMLQVYEERKIDPFLDNDPISRGQHPSLLYATDRAPVEAGDDEYYSDKRGGALRLGVASIRLGIDETITWEEARRISLLKNRTEDYPLEVDAVTEYGPLASTIRPFDDRFRPDLKPGRRFSEEIDRQLERSGRRDVFIYVHGYKVVFENPILVAAELWHFLGYQGAFVARRVRDFPVPMLRVARVTGAREAGRRTEP